METPEARLKALPKIELRGVSKRFFMNGRTLDVLEKIDLYVDEGEFVSIIGPSGCGKSTLFNIISGLEEPTEGTIFIDGQEAPHRLGAVGYMHQKDLLLPWRTVLDNVILGLEVQGVRKSIARVEAVRLLEEFGLRGFELSYPVALSGGMRQRAALLRTMLAGKKVMLLDEPFGALDALTRTSMQEWLLQIWERLKKTILFITHDVDEAVLLSSRVYVLTARPGRVKLVKEINLPRPRTYDMVTSQPFVGIKGELIAAIKEERLQAMDEESVWVGMASQRGRGRR